MKPGRPDQFVRLSGPPRDQIHELGDLAALPGTWMGTKGWSITALPGADSRMEDEGNYSLLIQPYTEILTFAPLGGLVRNEGGDVDQFIAGLRYDQRVAHIETGEALHVENGMWLNLADVQTQEGDPGPPVPFALCRTASVPHGNMAMLLGNATRSDAPPDIPDFSTLPRDVGSAPDGFLDPYQERRPGLDVARPGASLRATIAEQSIVATTTLMVDSANSGGVVNVPFINERAHVPRFSSWYWIETVLDPESGQTFDQLQYCQVIDIEFHRKFGGSGQPISWPHVTINTLKKQ